MVLALLTALALAGGNGISSGGLNGLPPTSSSGFTPGNAPNVVQATTGGMELYVDPTGSDSNSCTAPGTGACLTPQAAWNLIPKMVRHGVTIHASAGNYPGFIASGFFFDNSVQQIDGGITFDGAMATSTGLSGPATGTFSSAAQTSGAAFATGTDSTQTWAANELTGRFIITANPVNGPFVIDSNTGTTLTIDSPWTSTPTASTTYTIQDPSVVITTCTTRPGSTTLAATANYAGMQFFGTGESGYSLPNINITNVAITAPCSNGVAVEGSLAMQLKQMQIRNSLTTGSIAGVKVGSIIGGAPRVQLSTDDISINSTSAIAAGVKVISGRTSIASLRLRNAQPNGTALFYGGTSSTSQFPASAVPSFFNSTGFLNGVEMMGAISDDRINGSQLAHITCGAATGRAFIVGNDTSFDNPTQVGGHSSFGSIRLTTIATCGTAVQVIGPSSVDIISMAGSVATTGIDIRLGGTVTFAVGGITLTAGTNEINFDNGLRTSTFAAITTGLCKTMLGHKSAVCAR